MLANFIFDGSVGIKFHEKHYDLHSFFSIDGIIISPAEGKLSINLITLGAFRNNVHGVGSLRISFSGISYIEFSQGFCQICSDTIEEIGFKNPTDRDDNWLKTFCQSEEQDHLFIRFSNLEFMRIACATACVSVADAASDTTRDTRGGSRGHRQKGAGVTSCIDKKGAGVTSCIDISKKN
jgi:hypothetical protein